MGTKVLTPKPATPELILAEDFDGIEFQGSLKFGRLRLEGLLADQLALDALPVAVYVMELDGTLLRCNKASIAAWGRTPALGTTEKYCGAHLLRYPSGEVMLHEDAPPVVVIKNGGTVRDADVICERPDGTRLLARVNVFPIRDERGEVVGAVNIFVHNPHKRVPGLA